MTGGSVGTQLRRGVLGPCILNLLSGRPMYGLELVRELDSYNGILSSHGTIYPLLNRLEENGLVTSRWEVIPGARPRRYYTATPDGRREVEGFRADWQVFSSAISALLDTTVPANPEVGSNE